MFVNDADNFAIFISGTDLVEMRIELYKYLARNTWFLSWKLTLLPEIRHQFVKAVYTTN